MFEASGVWIGEAYLLICPTATLGLSIGYLLTSVLPFSSGGLGPFRKENTFYYFLMGTYVATAFTRIYSYTLIGLSLLLPN